MRANAKVAAVAAVVGAAAFLAFVGLAPQGASAPLAVTVTVPPLPVTTSGADTRLAAPRGRLLAGSARPLRRWRC